MDATTTTNLTANPGPTRKPTGLEDVARSIRGITRSARNLGESSAEVAERELAMAISISNRLRDDVFSTHTLQKAREEALPKKLRQDAHDTVNLVADLGAVLFLTATTFIENFVDDPRPPLTTQKGRVANTAPWHSVKTDVYHNNTACRTGNNIEPENQQSGTGGKSLCKECARLNAQPV